MSKYFWWNIFGLLVNHLQTITAIGEVVGVAILLYYGFGVLGKRPIQKRDVLIFRLTLVPLIVCALLFQMCDGHQW